MSTPSAAPSGSRRTWGWVVAAIVVVVAVVVAVILLTRPDDDASTASPSTVPSSASPSPTTTSTPPAPAPSPTSSATSTTATGCAPNDERPPSSADPVEVIDVDGDGRKDQAWISSGSGRRFGITTASGATFSAAIDSASPQPASAVVNVVQQEAIPIALVDLGREALLYSLTDCAVTPVQNAQGDPYTYDRGFADAGTGVGCSQDGDVLRLAGLNAVSKDDGKTFDVTRTFVDLAADGRHATNGDEATVATGAPKADAVVTTAQEVSCGDLVAGKDGPVEQQ